LEKYGGYLKLKDLARQVLDAIANPINIYNEICEARLFILSIATGLSREECIIEIEKLANEREINEH